MRQLRFVCASYAQARACLGESFGPYAGPGARNNQRSWLSSVVGLYLDCALRACLEHFSRRMFQILARLGLRPRAVFSLDPCRRPGPAPSQDRGRVQPSVECARQRSRDPAAAGTTCASCARMCVCDVCTRAPRMRERMYAHMYVCTRAPRICVHVHATHLSCRKGR